MLAPEVSTVASVVPSVAAAAAGACATCSKQRRARLAEARWRRPGGGRAPRGCSSRARARARSPRPRLTSAARVRTACLRCSSLASCCASLRRGGRRREVRAAPLLCLCSARGRQARPRAANGLRARVRRRCGRQRCATPVNRWRERPEAADGRGRRAGSGIAPGAAGALAELHHRGERVERRVRDAQMSGGGGSVGAAAVAAEWHAGCGGPRPVRSGAAVAPTKPKSGSATSLPRVSRRLRPRARLASPQPARSRSASQSSPAAKCGVGPRSAAHPTPPLSPHTLVRRQIPQALTRQTPLAIFPHLLGASGGPRCTRPQQSTEQERGSPHQALRSHPAPARWRSPRARRL
jgi:hypothetical protein